MEFERCLSLLDILPHPSVLKVLNKTLDTEDIISLTQVCKWTYNLWSFMLKFAVEFQMVERLTKKYGWKFKNAKNVIKQYRKKMTKCLIPEKDPVNKPVWCVGGCGKRVLCPRRTDTTNVANILTHNVCSNCSYNYFKKSRHWVVYFSLEDMIKERLGHDWTRFSINMGGMSDYKDHVNEFRNKNKVLTIFLHVVVFPKRDLEVFLEGWYRLYESKFGTKQIRCQDFDGYSF